MCIEANWCGSHVTPRPYTPTWKVHSMSTGENMLGAGWTDDATRALLSPCTHEIRTTQVYCHHGINSLVQCCNVNCIKAVSADVV